MNEPVLFDISNVLILEILNQNDSAIPYGRKIFRPDHPETTEPFSSLGS